MPNDKNQQSVNAERLKRKYLKISPFNSGSGDTRFVACVGSNGRYDQFTIYEGFKDAVCTLVQSIDEYENSPDCMVYPIMFCMRHSIELFLKNVLSRVRYINGAKENCTSFKKMRKALRLHRRLSYMVEECDSLFNGSDDDDINKKRKALLENRAAAIQRVIDSLYDKCFGGIGRQM